MSYKTLGSRGPVTGLLDTSGHNPGNWTVAFTPDIIHITQFQFEVYKIVVKGAPNTTFDVYVELYQWDTAIYGTKNSWDPSQPLIMRPGESLYICYSDAVADDIPPQATIWLRYDPDLLAV